MGASFGYLEKAENNHPTATLYLLSTDPTPGEYTQNGTNYKGWDIAKIPHGTSIIAFDNYIIPWENHGGKIYVWVKDAQENIINAVTIQEIDSAIIFSGDNQLHKEPNSIYIKDALIKDAFTTLCTRQKNADPLVCKWNREDGMNQQYILEVTADGTIILNRYSESRAKCAWNEPSCQYKKAKTYLQEMGDAIGNTFKDFGNDINKGFNKLGACMEVAALGTELTAKLAAKETILAGNLTDAILETAEESAIQPLIGARKMAEQVLEAAKGFLEKVGKPVATGSISAAQQTAAGTLQAGETVSVGVLTATDEAIKTILKTFNIQQIRYEGSLQKLASGNLGNVKCKALIAQQKVKFDFDLNIKDAMGSIKNLANKIADAIVTAAQASAKALHITEQKVHMPDDVIKLTMWHHTKHQMPLELLAFNDK